MGRSQPNPSLLHVKAKKGLAKVTLKISPPDATASDSENDMQADSWTNAATQQASNAEFQPLRNSQVRLLLIDLLPCPAACQASTDNVVTLFFKQQI